MREQFREFNFKGDTLETIRQANQILDEYRDQGYVLTLRQLYYQFVSRDWLANKQAEYKRLGSIVNDGRLAGLIDWSMIEDRTRNVRSVATWSTPSDIIRAAARSYREDLWEQQEYFPEVWIEKDALVGVIEDVCDEFAVPHFACRGYVSQSEQYSAGSRFAEAINRGKTPVILHLGDHDPSGIDMTRDIIDRVSLFAGDDIEVRRLALNYDQVEEHRPPPNPAKLTDSRGEGYIDCFGYSSWELDALEPRIINNLIRTELDTLIDQEQWSEDLEHQEANEQRLHLLSAEWSSVSDWLDNQERD